MTGEVDVAIVGAGPIGLAAAIEARLEGLTVALIDSRAFPIDKACGEGLMPGAVAALDRLGVHPAGHTIAGFRYADDRRSADYRFRGATGLGVRRTTLHNALAARAAELGVRRVDARVSQVAQDASGVTVGDVRASWLFACDGLHSTVRRLAGLESPHPAPVDRPAAPTRRAAVDRRRFGLSRHYAVQPWNDLVEVYWARSAEVYVTPLGPRSVGVAVLGPPHTSFDDTVAGIPQLAARLEGAEPDGATRGAGPLRQRTIARSAGRILLLGDASGYVDALTGEGIRVGLGHAHAAVTAIVASGGGGAAAYERSWTTVSRDFRVVTMALLALAQSPARRIIVPAARAAPAVFGAVVERLAR